MAIRRAAGVTSEPTSSGVVILSADGKVMTTLNRTGAYLWTLLAEKQQPAALATALRNRYPDACDEDLLNDVQHFVGELDELGLVVIE